MKTNQCVGPTENSHPRAVTLALLLFLGSLYPCSAPNIVGYVNVQMQPGFTLVSCPLDEGQGGCNLSAVFSAAPDGTVVHRWGWTNQAYNVVGIRIPNLVWISSAGITNDTNAVIPVGEAFWVESPSGWTNTFVGSVVSSPTTNPIYANYNLLGCKLPIGGELTNAGPNTVNFPSRSGDKVWKWNGSFTLYSRGPSTWSPSVPSIDVGEGIMVFRTSDQATPANWWIQILDNSARPAARSAFPVSPLAGDLEQLRFEGDEVVLQIHNPEAIPLNVEFSVDSEQWQTIATAVTDPVWRGPAPASLQGFYRVVQP